MRIAAGIVITVDEPDLRLIENALELLVQGLSSLQIAEENHRRRLVLMHRLKDMLEAAVGVAAEEKPRTAQGITARRTADNGRLERAMGIEPTFSVHASC